jgi:hypothetical protein
MKRLKKFFAAIFLLFFIANFSTDAFATVTICHSRFFLITVDGGLPFIASGYEAFTEDSYPVYFRLRDLAYILNGTSAQFNFTAGEGGVDFWIERGAEYTPDFTELQHFPERFASVNGQFLPHHSVGFTREPFRSITLGFDGEASPASIISMGAIADVDDIYFSLSGLSYWLGFNYEYDAVLSSHRGYMTINTTPRNQATPSGHITRDTFPIGSRQSVAYAHTLTVRTEPRNDSRILTYVHRGDEFEILDYNGRFVQIETAQGLGWIFSGFLSRRYYAAAPVFTRNDAETRAVLELITSYDENDEWISFRPWVDRSFLSSQAFDESLISPLGFFVFPLGGSWYYQNYPFITGFSAWDFIDRYGFYSEYYSRPIMPVTAHELEPGIFELRYDFSRPLMYTAEGDVWGEPWWEERVRAYENHRIVVDTNNIPVETFRYYIGETSYDMVRLNIFNFSDYTAEPIDGGIRLAYRLPYLNTFFGSTLRLYRSTVRGERGRLVWENDLRLVWDYMENYSDADISWLYEYLDTGVSEGGTYFYSLWVREPEARRAGQSVVREHPVLFGDWRVRDWLDGEWQMVVALPLEVEN